MGFLSYIHNQEVLQCKKKVIDFKWTKDLSIK